MTESERATMTRPGSAMSGMSKKPHSSIAPRISAMSSGRLGICRLGTARVVSVGRRKAAADVEPGERHAGAVPHPVRRGERALIDVRVLDLAADMKAEADAEADPVDALQQLDGMRRRGAEFLSTARRRRRPWSVAARRA